MSREPTPLVIRQTTDHASAAGVVTPRSGPAPLTATAALTVAAAAFGIGSATAQPDDYTVLLINTNEVTDSANCDNEIGSPSSVLRGMS